MEDAWIELGESFANSKSKLIGEVDCTSELAQSICENEGIDGFPTIKYGMVYDMEEYGGPRDYENLKKFADKNLKAMCGPNHLQLCDKATRKEIRRLKGLTLEELDKEIADTMEKYNALIRKFDADVEALEEAHEAAAAKNKADKAKGGDLTLMKAVLEIRKEQEAEKEKEKKIDEKRGKHKFVVPPKKN